MPDMINNPAAKSQRHFETRVRPGQTGRLFTLPNNRALRPVVRRVRNNLAYFKIFPLTY
jgi:hypothetical protein